MIYRHMLMLTWSVTSLIVQNYIFRLNRFWPCLALFARAIMSANIYGRYAALNILQILRGGVKRLYYTMKWKRLSNKYQIYIHPNTVGKGLYIPHFHGGVQLNCLSMGDYCTVSAGVIVGNKGSQENRATIGNNVELAVGCKVIGKITIGDNAVVCPNSVVIKDVPVNAIVSGVPAQVIKVR